MRIFIVAAAGAVSLFSSATFALEPNQDRTPMPDFSGIWAHLSWPDFEPPLAGPGPVTNRARLNGRSNIYQLVGDYTSPILKPQAAEVVKKHGEMELSGAGSPTPTIQCWPEPVP